MKKDRLALYRVDMKYVRDLHNKDDKVSSVSPQIGKDTRVYVGIIVVCDKHKYCVPLSHAEIKKHDKMKGSVDFSKVFDEKNKLIAVLNFNLMIPVQEAQLQKVDMKIKPNDTEKDKHYKKLCQSELNWCQKHSDDIINKANVLYKMYKDNEKFKARERCVDFLKLEKVCEKYNEKHTNIKSNRNKFLKMETVPEVPYTAKMYSGGTIALAPPVSISLLEPWNNLAKALKLTIQSLGNDIKKLGSNIKKSIANTIKDAVKPSGKYEIADRSAEIEKPKEVRKEKIDRSNKPNLQNDTLKSKQKEVEEYKKEHTISPKQHNKNKGRE